MSNISSALVSYQANGQEVKLSPAMVRNYLVSGNGNVTDKEVVMFINLCKFNGLNPFLREAHLVKYGNKDATMVTAIDALKKRANANANYRGYKAGVILQKPDGDLEYRVGAFKLPNETLVGGWAKVFVDGVCDFESAVAIEEYIGTKGDGTVNSMWGSKPCTMIRKVALAHALREAYPENSQLYIADEMDVPDTPLPVEPVVVPDPAPAPERGTYADIADAGYTEQCDDVSPVRSLKDLQ